MLLVFVEEVVENFLVEKGDALEVVATARLKAHDLVNKAVRFVGEVGNVLLPLHLLLDVGGVVSDLELDRVCHTQIKQLADRIATY